MVPSSSTRYGRSDSSARGRSGRACALPPPSRLTTSMSRDRRAHQPCRHSLSFEIGCSRLTKSRLIEIQCDNAFPANRKIGAHVLASCEERKATKRSRSAEHDCAKNASRSLSSGGASRRPMARNDRGVGSIVSSRAGRDQLATPLPSRCHDRAHNGKAGGERAEPYRIFSTSFSPAASLPNLMVRRKRVRKSLLQRVFCMKADEFRAGGDFSPQSPCKPGGSRGGRSRIPCGGGACCGARPTDGASSAGGECGLLALSPSLSLAPKAIMRRCFGLLIDPRMVAPVYKYMTSAA